MGETLGAAVFINLIMVNQSLNPTIPQNPYQCPLEGFFSIGVDTTILTCYSRDVEFG